MAGSDEEAAKSPLEKTKKLAVEQCKKQIPGDRYENFQLFDYTDNYEITIILIPFYEVTYEYDGKEYTCYFDGNKEHYAFSNSKPINKDLELQQQQINDEIDTLKKTRLKKGIFTFAVYPLLIVVFSFIIFILLIDETHQVTAIPVLLLLAAVCLEVASAIEFYKQYKNVKNKEIFLSNHISNLDQKRKAIAAIVKEDNLSAEEQKEKIKQIIS